MKLCERSGTKDSITFASESWTVHHGDMANSGTLALNASMTPTVV